MKGTFPFVQKLKMYIQHVVIIVLLTVLASLAVTLFRTPEFETRARILVIQRQTTPDAFTASQSAAYVASLLQEGIASDTFYNVVAQKNTAMAQSLPSDTIKRRKAWAKKVTTSLASDKGVLTINAYDMNKDAAQKLGEQVVETVLATGNQYHGAGDSITLRILDAPITSERPARPNLLLNLLAGLIVGTGLSFAFLLLVSAPSSDEEEVEEPIVPAPSFYAGRIVPMSQPAPVYAAPVYTPAPAPMASALEDYDLPLQIKKAPAPLEVFGNEAMTEHSDAEEPVVPVAPAPEPVQPTPAPALEKKPAEGVQEKPQEQKQEVPPVTQTVSEPAPDAPSSIQNWMKRR